MFTKKKPKPKVVEKIAERVVYVCPTTIGHTAEAIRARIKTGKQ